MTTEIVKDCNTCPANWKDSTRDICLLKRDDHGRYQEIDNNPIATFCPFKFTAI